MNRRARSAVVVTAAAERESGGGIRQARQAQAGRVPVTGSLPGLACLARAGGDGRARVGFGLGAVGAGPVLGCRFGGAFRGGGRADGTGVRRVAAAALGRGRLTQEELAEAAGLVRGRSVTSSGASTGRPHGPRRAARRSARPGRVGADAVRRGGSPLVPRRRCWRPGGAAPGTFAAAATRTLPRDTAASPAAGASSRGSWARSAAWPTNGGVMGIHTIDGIAGIGDHLRGARGARLAEAFPDGQFFLPLHAHTPGRRRSAR